ncbi:hypothetical protein H112_06012 [Trichophyton rubrum D6]|uniref:INO80 complex subunit F domain-containing protein n=3 Tax=Trichophyton TaxID=5550 RepID=F2SLN9_TRIRC|nr:uncharacterized protein TERG_03717 [Trichophyton rubrum CBS 118892]EZF14843.1 hypothetical protein H100_06026 [Trichophyton rubrum MR850]EZF39960.1 hypothetical protein H102_05995 [Trichophyton rubrum CBS 100081]EZF50600.1 hypothetical protein H103_06020 [Trichophyton rubrum CBS 288.86]EZF61144.1 hypothetical protein H104_06008 [Trichophyton rubrum CBS 289.86]EZF71777.1 hypothetical protein H105_06035 [Trichophyton soudanense CBS 452.61]EZF82360.1 hypothetical protein H110_06016 [Trichophy
MASEPDSNLHANPQNASMPPHPNPPSIEAAYKRKCIALKKRLNEVETHNEAMRLRNAQGIRYIQKMRLESCMILERLSVLMGMADGSGRQGEPEAAGRAMALMRESGHVLDEERSRAGQKRPGEDLDALGEESDGSSGHHPPTVRCSCFLPLSFDGGQTGTSEQLLTMLRGCASHRNALYDQNEAARVTRGLRATALAIVPISTMPAIAITTWTQLAQPFLFQATLRLHTQRPCNMNPLSFPFHM